MTRSQAKAFLVAIGVAEPTDEQITTYLNQVGEESARERSRADKYKADADRVAELQKQLDDLNNANLSEIEKANKATEDANKKVTSLEATIRTMQQKQSLAELGITGEVADKLIGADGALDFATLGQIISDRETAAAVAKEKELASGASNPSGGNTGKQGEEKTSAEKIAEAVGKSLGGSGKASGDILSSYLN